MSNVVNRLKYQPQIYIARTKDGHVVSINDVLNEKLPSGIHDGLKCECCNNTVYLVAEKSDSMQPHFRHEPGVECSAIRNITESSERWRSAAFNRREQELTESQVENAKVRIEELAYIFQFLDRESVSGTLTSDSKKVFLDAMSKLCYDDQVFIYDYSNTGCLRDFRQEIADRINENALQLIQKACGENIVVTKHDKDFRVYDNWYRKHTHSGGLLFENKESSANRSSIIYGGRDCEYFWRSFPSNHGYRLKFKANQFSELLNDVTKTSAVLLEQATQRKIAEEKRIEQARIAEEKRRKYWTDLVSENQKYEKYVAIKDFDYGIFNIDVVRRYENSKWYDDSYRRAVSPYGENYISSNNNWIYNNDRPADAKYEDVIKINYEPFKQSLDYLVGGYYDDDGYNIANDLNDSICIDDCIEIPVGDITSLSVADVKSKMLNGINALLRQKGVYFTFSNLDDVTKTCKLDGYRYFGYEFDCIPAKYVSQSKKKENESVLFVNDKDNHCLIFLGKTEEECKKVNGGYHLSHDFYPGLDYSEDKSGVRKNFNVKTMFYSYNMSRVNAIIPTIRKDLCAQIKSAVKQSGVSKDVLIDAYDKANADEIAMTNKVDCDALALAMMGNSLSKTQKRKLPDRSNNVVRESAAEYVRQVNTAESEKTV